MTLTRMTLEDVGIVGNFIYFLLSGTIFRGAVLPRVGRLPKFKFSIGGWVQGNGQPDTKVSTYSLFS